MDSAELTKLQRTSFRLLSNTFDQDALQTTCPLDHGRHNPSAKYDLGVLSRLPTELQHQILGDVDVQSLLTFRRVNQTAMLVVNAMLEYHKVNGSFRSTWNLRDLTESKYRSSRSHRAAYAWLLL
jgi:hypothetical protein